jgi:hypothetical protein
MAQNDSTEKRSKPTAPESSLAEKRQDQANQPSSRTATNRVPLLYCPTCAREIDDPLTCGDCSAVICRTCGTPLESADDLAMGD